MHSVVGGALWPNVEPAAAAAAGSLLFIQSPPLLTGTGTGGQCRNICSLKMILKLLH